MIFGIVVLVVVACAVVTVTDIRRGGLTAHEERTATPAPAPAPTTGTWELYRGGRR